MRLHLPASALRLLSLRPPSLCRCGFRRSVTLASVALSLCFSASSAEAISAAALESRLQSGERLVLVDVRPTTAYADAHIPGALNIPLTLLPHKKLPAGVPVIAYTDGLGLIAEADARAAIQRAGGSSADVLEGGFSAWQTHTRISTAAGGLQREKLPGITYDQLVAADKSDVVLVDLRASAGDAAAAAPSAPGTLAAAAAPAPDLVAAFASRLGVPVQRSSASSEGIAAAAAPSAPGLSAASVASSAGPAPLLVLVADDETTANEAARRLRASGNHRFTILIGGTEIIKHDGRRGMGRQGGELPVVASQP